MEYLKDRIMSKIGPWSSVLEGSMPCYDVLEGKENLIIKLNVPGVTEEDLDISTIGEDMILVKGTRRKGVEGFNYIHEGRSKDLKKLVYVPRSSELDKAEARLESGVLTIEVPKKDLKRNEEDSKGVKIEVS